uniref:MBL fold metallo-hydrolase n=1 Tax=candidate division WOR-3 bacterium TaxID=2052148 RepID=A0A7C4TAA4_UNCW3
MLIRFYGTRGSLPVSSTETLKYGGNTTCVYIETQGGKSIIIDAGSGIRELGDYLIKNNKFLLYLVFTHYHWDHIQGFPFFAPLYNRKTIINVYGPTKEVDPEQALSYQMNVPYFPTIRLTDLPARFNFKKFKSKFTIGDAHFFVIYNNHPNFTYGIKIKNNKKTVVFLTDNELRSPNPRTPYEKFVRFIKNADLLIHDAQYNDETYKCKIGWGHSTFSQVMEFARDGSVKNVIFTHHDPFSSDEFINEVLAKIRKRFPEFNIDAAKTGTEIKI